MEDYDIKRGTQKVAVVFLNSAPDFVPWNVAVRRLAKGCNMGDALMFSVPENQYKAYRIRFEAMAESLTREGCPIWQASQSRGRCPC